MYAMRYSKLVLVALLLLPVGLDGAAGQRDSTEIPDSKARFDALQKEYRDAWFAFVKKLRAAESEEARKKLVETESAGRSEYARKFLELANRNPGTEVAVECLAWILRLSQDSQSQTKAIGQLARDHVKSPAMLKVSRLLLDSSSPEAESLLRRVIEENPDEGIQGVATLTLGLYLNRMRGQARLLQDPIASEAAEDTRKVYGEEFAAALARRDLAQMKAESVAILERVIDEYSDVPPGVGNLVDSAEWELHKLRNLDIGMTAPAIEGEDILGERFQLADYRGKVVVLTFWGHW